MQAISGLMSLTGDPNSEPYRAGISVFDVMAGLHATIGILAAVNLRHETGRGQHVEVNLIATAVAGAILEINPFDQPNVQEAKDRTKELLDSGGFGVEPESSVDELLAQARPGDYVAVQAFVDPAEEERLRGFVDGLRARADCVVTFGLGPRYLHSTGQLHKGGAPIGCFLQVVDEIGDELAIPGQKFGFGRLIQAQAAGDYAALKERGRPVARVQLKEIV